MWSRNGGKGRPEPARCLVADFEGAHGSLWRVRGEEAPNLRSGYGPHQEIVPRQIQSVRSTGLIKTIRGGFDRGKIHKDTTEGKRRL